jgi:hypothetical protein
MSQDFYFVIKQVYVHFKYIYVCYPNINDYSFNK